MRSLALPLLYWQWVAPVRDLSDAAGDPSVHSSYYQPLLAELERRTRGRPVRVEIPPTRNRWEADYVAPRFPLARGWLRQLESGDFDLFTGGNLTAGGVSVVARRPRGLLRGGPGREASTICRRTRRR